MKQMAVAAFAMILLSAFKNNRQDVSLYETKWYLAKIHAGAQTEEIAGKKAFIKFNEEKKSAGGNGSCNSFGSTLTVSKDSISIKNILSTKMYCEGVQQIENVFFRQLEKIDRFEIKENTLLLYQGREVLLEFEK